MAGWALPIADIESGLAAQSVPVKVAVAPLTAAGTPAAGVVNTVPGAAMVAVPAELAPDLIGAGAGAAARDRLVAAGLPLGDEPPAAALGRLEGDLEQSARGRGLVTFWLRHQYELLDLINTNRRVVVTWYRSGASGLFQLLTRMLSQPDLTVPQTINGQPVSQCLDAVYAVLDRFASAQLRADLAAARAALPELGGLTYPRDLLGIGGGLMVTENEALAIKTQGRAAAAGAAGRDRGRPGQQGDRRPAHRRAGAEGVRHREAPG